MEQKTERDSETPAIGREVMPKKTSVEKRRPSVPVSIDDLTVIEAECGVTIGQAGSEIIAGKLIVSEPAA